MLKTIATGGRYTHRQLLRYLHVGLARSITLNFGLAEEFGGNCNPRFDDTNRPRRD
jgi:hypothetical protein